MKSLSSANNAFTLIELAIVIVIIGLLVGGVLGGQELVKQAKIRNTVKEMQAYQTAFLTFKTKYNYYPGDFPQATAQTVFGFTCNWGGSTQFNGNNQVDWWWTGGCGPEEWEVWRHMSLAKMIKGAYAGQCPTPCLKQNNAGLPFLSAIPDAAYYIDYHTVFNQTANLLNIMGASDSGPYNLFGPGLSREFAYAIDSKIDDGRASTGTFLSVDQTYPRSGINITCVSFSQYTDIYNETPACISSYKLD